MPGWRKSMKKSVMVFGLFLTTISQAFACKCLPAGLDQHVKASSRIFLGTVVGIVPDLEGHSAVVSFSIKKSWKGVTGLRTQVKALRGTSCDVRFELNKEYLVFASDEHPVHLCDGTLEAGKASDQIKA